MAFSTKIKGHHHLQGNVQVYNVRIPAVLASLFGHNLCRNEGQVGAEIELWRLGKMARWIRKDWKVQGTLRKLNPGFPAVLDPIRTLELQNNVHPG